MRALIALALAALLTACGGGSEPLDASKSTTEPIACGGGISGSMCK